jgi:hypothetical protein
MACAKSLAFGPLVNRSWFRSILGNGVRPCAALGVKDPLWRLGALVSPPVSIGYVTLVQKPDRSLSLRRSKLHASAGKTFLQIQRAYQGSITSRTPVGLQPGLLPSEVSSLCLPAALPRASSLRGCTGRPVGSNDRAEVAVKVVVDLGFEGNELTTKPTLRIIHPVNT